MALCPDQGFRLRPPGPCRVLDRRGRALSMISLALPLCSSSRIAMTASSAVSRFCCRASISGRMRSRTEGSGRPPFPRRLRIWAICGSLASSKFVRTTSNRSICCSVSPNCSCFSRSRPIEFRAPPKPCPCLLRAAWSWAKRGPVDTRIVNATTAKHFAIFPRWFCVGRVFNMTQVVAFC